MLTSAKNNRNILWL